MEKWTKGRLVMWRKPPKKVGIMTAIVVGIVVAIVIVATGAYLLFSSFQKGQLASSSTTLLTTPTASSTVITRSSSTLSALSIIIPHGAGNGSNDLPLLNIFPPNFTPANITIVIGINNTITWTDEDYAPHTVTFQSGPSGSQHFDSGQIGQGDKFTVTLSVPGTYVYICIYHADWMKGRIVVLAHT